MSNPIRTTPEYVAGPRPARGSLRDLLRNTAHGAPHPDEGAEGTCLEGPDSRTFSNFGNGTGQPASRNSGRAISWGFTLLELLVSLTIMSVVVTLLYTGFAQISENAVELTRELESRQALRVLLKVVMDDLQSVQYLPNWAKNRPSGLVASIRYEEAKPFTWVRFHAAVPTRFYRNLEQGGDPGLHEIAYRVERDRELDLLTLTRREDFYLDRDLEEGGITLTMAEGITVFKVEFLQPSAGAGNFDETWSETWDSADSIGGRRLPPAIRLTIAQIGPGGKEFTESLEFNLMQSATTQ